MEILLKKAQVFQSRRYLLSGAAPLLKSEFINKIYRTSRASDRSSVTVCPATERQVASGVDWRAELSGRAVLECLL